MRNRLSSFPRIMAAGVIVWMAGIVACADQKPDDLHPPGEDAAIRAGTGNSAVGGDTDGGAPGRIVTLTDETITSEISRTRDIPLVIEFAAAWSGPSKKLAPVMSAIAAESAGSVRVARVDVDANMNAQKDFSVTQVPLLIVFLNGKEAGRLTGLKSRDGIEEFVAGLVESESEPVPGDLQ